MWVTLGLWYLAWSAAAWVALWSDKRAAAHGRWRTPERVLHAIELVGGWPGSLAASAVLRHKSRALRYRIVRGLIVAMHLLAWASVMAVAWRGGRG